MTMKKTTMFGTAILISLALMRAAGVHADSLDHLPSIGTAGRVEKAGGAFVPVRDNASGQSSEMAFLIQGGLPPAIDPEPIPDVWVLAEGAWNHITDNAPRVYGHALVAAADGRAYALGGVGQDDWIKDLDRVTAYEVRRVNGRLEVEIEDIAVAGPCPDACIDAAAVAIDSGRGILYISGFCGFDSDPWDVNPGQVWEYRIDDNRWLRRADMPATLHGHSAVAHRDYVYVFGGNGAEGRSNDVYRYDVLTDTWAAIETSGEEPTPRSDHRAVIAGNTMLIFGGIETAFYPETMDDIQALDLETMTWSEKTHLPTGLANMAVGVIPSQSSTSSKVQVLLYGGLEKAWSFPHDLSDSTLEYTSDVSVRRTRAISSQEPLTIR
jgi:hypothetical protein